MGGNRMTRRALVGGLLALTWLGTGAAQAQNLLPNPDFDADLGGWSVDAGMSHYGAGWPAGVFTPGDAWSRLHLLWAPYRMSYIAETKAPPGEGMTG